MKASDIVFLILMTPVAIALLISMVIFPGYAASPKKAKKRGKK